MFSNIVIIINIIIRLINIVGDLHKNFYHKIIQIINYIVLAIYAGMACLNTFSHTLLEAFC